MAKCNCNATACPSSFACTQNIHKGVVDCTLILVLFDRYMIVLLARLRDYYYFSPNKSRRKRFNPMICSTMKWKLKKRVHLINILSQYPMQHCLNFWERHDKR